MLDFADVVAINKFERRGAEDALRDVGRQLVRNREAFGKQPEDMPVFGTSRRDVQRRRRHRALPAPARPARRARAAARRGHARPGRRPALLAASARSCPPTGCATSPRSPRRSAATTPAPSELADAGAPRAAARGTSPTELGDERAGRRRPACSRRPRELPAEVAEQLAGWPAVVESYSGDEQVVKVRDKEIHTTLTRESLSGNKIPPGRAAARTPTTASWCASGAARTCPATSRSPPGVFPFKRDDEDPARMFAGEGDPSRTNRRFKLLSAGTATPPGCRRRSTR